LTLVEGAHFTPEVENLIKGITSSLGGELDYTLRAYPNHHRALLSLARLAKRTKSAQPFGLHYSVECYFERGIRFRPDDTTVRMIYAIFLFDNARPADAERQLEQVDKLSGDNGFAHYNMGLIYFERNQFDKALIQAQKAFSLGFTRPDLYNKLKAAGKWTAPEPRTEEPVKTPPSAASDILK
jgi:tetratricopeptide (TPR) repeat protein